MGVRLTGERYSEETHSHTGRQEVWCSPVVISVEEEMSNKTTEVIHKKNKKNWGEC